MLLNLDKPLQAATLHSDECSHVPQPVATPLKPIDEVGRDGGWFRVASLEDAESVAARELPDIPVRECSFCRA